MRRLGVSCVVVMVSSFIALVAPSPARGARACPYGIIVSRQDHAGEQSARVCDLNRIAEWLAAVPDASVSTRRPQGALHDAYTRTVVAGPPPHAEVPP